MKDESSSSIDRAIGLVGGQAALARALGVTPSAVSQCASGYRPIPARWAIDICRATAGAVAPYDLRPDLYPDPEWRPADVQALRVAGGAL